MNKNYEEIEEELENKDYEEELENEDLQDEDEMANDNRTDDEYANGYRREGRTCADCIYSDCDGNQLCSLFEPW
mgnify:FL=1